jgi:putative ABC transport system substrate-binding protein
MDRRRFLLTSLVGVMTLGGVLAAARFALAQQSGRTYRIGILEATGKRAEPYYVAFDQRLRELGFAEGQNLAIEFRTSRGRVERLPELAADLVRQNCDVLVAFGIEAILVALEQASQNTPIVVVALDYDPEATGHIASLGHPGGRITGVSAVQSVLPAKRLELLKELLPKARRIAVFSDIASTGQLEVARTGAKRLGVELQVVEFRRAPYDYESAFAEAVRVKAEALLVLGSANFVLARPLIPELALKHRLPSIFHHSVWADAGGLLSYGPNFSDVFGRAAEQVSRILKGAKPGELPVQQPTKFELVINLKTAKALGLTIPPSLLARADHVIE